MSYRVISRGQLKPAPAPIVNYIIDYRLIYDDKKRDISTCIGYNYITAIINGCKLTCF